MGYTNRTNIKKPVIVVGRVGALCGNVHLIKPPAWVTDNALIIDDIKCYFFEYILLLLEIINLNRLSNQNAQPLVTGGMIKTQHAILPSIEEQKNIVKYCSVWTTKIDKMIAKVQESIAKLREYRTALISAAVTGKIDVRKEVA